MQSTGAPIFELSKLLSSPSGELALRCHTHMQWHTFDDVGIPLLLCTSGRVQVSQPVVAPAHLHTSETALENSLVVT